MRLNRYLATATGLSRRAADNAIREGRVRLNDQIATLGQLVGESDVVAFDETPVTVSEHRYIAFHKPIGLVSSRRQQGNNPTIYAALPEEFATLKPVGRLDKDSSGLLVLTTDGIWANELTHPRYEKLKRYLVHLDAKLNPADEAKIGAGVVLEDGPSHLKIKPSGNDWLVEMTEGRNRQIRRTFAALGYRVTRLERISFGKLALGGLGKGEWRDIHPGDVA